MAVTTASTLSLSDICLEIYGSSNTSGRSLMQCHADASGTFDSSYAVSGSTLLDFRGYRHVILLPEPATLAFSNQTTSSIDVEILPAARANTYQLFRKIQGGSWQNLGTYNSPTTITDNSLDDAVIYYYYVITTNAGGSTNSEVHFSVTEPIPRAIEPETTTYLNELGIPNNNNIIFSGTPQEKTNSQIWNYFNHYILELKAAGLFDKTKADYPMLGGTAGQHKINLKDINYATINWRGSWVHDPLGATGNGSNTIADINVLLTQMVSLNNYGASTVVGTNNPANIRAVEVASGFVNINDKLMALGAKIPLTGGVNAGVADKIDKYLIGTRTDARGIRTVVRTNDIDTALYANGSVEKKNTNSPSAIDYRPQAIIQIGGSHGNFRHDGLDYSGFNQDYCTQQRIQGVLIHEGLTDTESKTLEEILNVREALLRRKTWIYESI